MTGTNRLADIVARHRDALLPEWMRHQIAATTMRRDLIREDELADQSRRFLELLRASLQNDGAANDVSGPIWAPMRDLLTELSRSRARQGFSPSETATFVFSL